MAYAENHVVNITTDGSGDAIGYTPVVRGRVNAIKYVKDDFAAGVDFTITTEDTLQGLWTETDVNASKTVAPRQPTHSDVGVASLYAAGGEPVEDHILAAGERIKIVVASGGPTKSGQFIVITE